MDRKSKSSVYKRAMEAIQQQDTELYKELSEDDKKKFSPYTLMMSQASVGDIDEGTSKTQRHIEPGTQGFIYPFHTAYIPRIRIGLFSDFSFSQHIVLPGNYDIPHISFDCRFRKSPSVMVPKNTFDSENS